MNYINVRGCNGSGKTTLLRDLVLASARRDLTSVEVADHKPIPVTLCDNGVAIIGDYRPEGAHRTTAGLDCVKTQNAAKDAIYKAGKIDGVKCVLFEGVVVSTIFGPWLEWSQAFGPMTWAFLDTPLDVCLARIQKRNGGKPIKEDQVAFKHNTIVRVHRKAAEAGEDVASIPHLRALESLQELLAHV